MHFELIWLAYPLLGAVVGFMAGLLGVGGGLMTVPFLSLLLSLQGMNSAVELKVALGTSMAVIACTSFSSFISHHKHGNVEWVIVRKIMAGLLMGAYLGGALVAMIPNKPLAVVFVVFALYSAMQFLLNFKPAAHRILPSTPIINAFGAVAGVLSAMLSAGGGFIVVPFLTWCNVPMKKAVGTSAACGFPIAVAGAISYIYHGWHAPNLSAYNLGFVHWPSFLGIAITSVLLAPVGAALSNRLPVKILKQIFGVMLLLIAAQMARRYLF